MCLNATAAEDYRSWNYLIGNFHTGRSIALERTEWLRELSWQTGGELKLALKDPIDGGWTKHAEYHKITFNISTAYDIHRSILANEAVTETDLPTYEENASAMHALGSIIENKGFVPHYYYSGNKSIHCSTYLDWTVLFDMDKYVQNLVIEKHTSPNVFKKKFMEWLRGMLTSCWGTKALVGDEQLIAGSHLIRAELSRNEFGYKTFLGHTHRDIPPFPIVCNEENGLLPDLGAMILSRPPQIQEIVEEYLASLDKKAVKAKAKRKERALDFFLHGPVDDTKLKGCVQFLLSDEFCKLGDGYRRAMFFLANDVKRAQGANGVSVLLEWNQRCGSPLKEQDIMYIFAREKTYELSHAQIHDFLETLGIHDIGVRCNG